MIALSKLNDVPFVLNCDMIETIAANPDTTITLNNGKIFIVKESVDEVVRKALEYRREVFCKLLNPRALAEEED